MTRNSTLDAFKADLARPIVDPRLQAIDGLAKSTFGEPSSPTSGLNFYDLENGAKILVPVLTPLRNAIPRVSGRGGTQANWRAVTAINASGLRIGVSEGARGGVAAVQTADYIATYKGIGIETSVDFEAQYAANNFVDLRALASQSGLQSLMIGEEAIILGGNSSLSLGVTPAPTVVGSVAGGKLIGAVWSVICVALSFDGLVNGSVLGGVQGQIARMNADGSSDSFGGGAAAPSESVTVTIAAGTTAGSLSASVPPVRGAAGYAWFWGAAGSETLGAVTTINSVIVTAPASGSQTAASLGAGDNSTNSLVFDGLLTLAAKPGSNAYVYTMPSGAAGVGTPLTADGTGGVVEIDAVLKYMWDNYRLSPDSLWVSSQEALDVSRKILTGSSGAAQRFVFDSRQDAIGGGVMVRTYLNRFSMSGGAVVDVKVHPNMPAGTMLFTTRSLPYPLANVGNVMQIRARQDYYQIEWPQRTRRYEYGVYADEVLQHYFPPSLAVITNIGAG